MDDSRIESVRVAGRAWRAVPPGRTVWRIGVRERDDAEGAALERCREHAEAVATRIRGVVGEAGHVWTSDVELNRLMVEERHDGFEAECSVISEGPARTAGQVAGEALSVGASYLGGPALSVSSHDHTHEELLLEAVRDARAKAEALAYAAGRRCGRVLSVEERDWGGGPGARERDPLSDGSAFSGLQVARAQVWLEVELIDAR